MKKKQLALGKIIEYENNPRNNEMATASMAISLLRGLFSYSMILPSASCFFFTLPPTCSPIPNGPSFLLSHPPTYVSLVE